MDGTKNPQNRPCLAFSYSIILTILIWINSRKRDIDNLISDDVACQTWMPPAPDTLLEYIIPTDEEMVIARDTKALVE